MTSDPGADADSDAKTIIVMGVCGCGKTTFGKALAERLDAAYIEGDRLHPPANIDKMSRGIPLQDEDRVPWLKSIVEAAETSVDSGRSAVIACSALKKAYRNLLRTTRSSIEFVHLSGPRETVLARVGSRPDHYMPASLVDSQYEALESTRDEPDVVELDLDIAVEQNLERYLENRASR